VDVVDYIYKNNEYYLEKLKNQNIKEKINNIFLINTT